MDYQKLQSLLDKGVLINEDADKNDIQVEFLLNREVNQIVFTPEKYKDEKSLAKVINIKVSCLKQKITIRNK